MLDHPPQSAASQVVPPCRCRKRRPPTLSHTAPIAAKQCQPPQSAASSQPDKHEATPGRQHDVGRRRMSTTTPFKLATCTEPPRHASGRPSAAWPRSVSTNNAFNKVATPKTPSSLVQQVNRVFTRRNPRRKDGVTEPPKLNRLKCANCHLNT